ncbi:MAG: rRNA maturation RNase YbeY [Balneolaceae bacterium]
MNNVGDIDTDPSEYGNRSVLQVFNPSYFDLPIDESTLLNILAQIEQGEKAAFSLLEVVYVDEDEIIRINQKYLDRDFITDIISFRYDEGEANQSIEGTLYCCAPRIAEQASEFGASRAEEFYRVFIHGLLHLIGYDDQSNVEKEQMTLLEDQYLKQGIS